MIFAFLKSPRLFKKDDYIKQKRVSQVFLLLFALFEKQKQRMLGYGRMSLFLDSEREIEIERDKERERERRESV